MMNNAGTGVSLVLVLATLATGCEMLDLAIMNRD
jgi:hypothetical protein